MTFSIAEPFMLFGPAYRKGLGLMFLSGLIFYLASLLVTVPIALFGLATKMPGSLGTVRIVFQAVFAYLIMAANWGAVTEITLAKIANRPIGLGEVLRRGVASAFPVLLVGLLWFLGFMVGWILLLIPGAIFACVFAVPVPAMLHDKTGLLGAFSRARELTKGHRWAIFGIYLVVNFGIYITILIGALAVSAIVGGGPIGVDGLSSMGNMGLVIAIPLAIVMGLGLYAVILVPPVMNACLYAALRAARGEPVTGNLAKVFE